MSRWALYQCTQGAPARPGGAAAPARSGFRTATPAPGGPAQTFALDDWLRVLIDAVAPHLDRESAYIGTLLGGVQMLRTGITLTNDMFVCDPRPSPVTPGVVQALEELGLRGIVSYGASDRRPGAVVEDVFVEHDALAESAAASRLCRFRLGIATVAAQSPSMFERSVEFAASRADGVHIHLHESREEIEFVRSSPSGVCPVSRLRGRGITVGLGVDGPASNDRQDMLEAIKTAVLLQRVDRLDPLALTAREVFRMATIEGAAALRLSGTVGSLEPGRRLTWSCSTVTHRHSPTSTTPSRRSSTALDRSR